MSSKNFITTQWLAEHLGSPDLAVIDASWHLPTSGRSASAEFLAGHIPGAVFFDIDGISDTSSSLPHMLPDPAAFSKAMSDLGFGDAMRFVVYDSIGLFSAARVWWTLRAFGAQDVKILEGGLPRWIAEGRPLESGEAARKPERFTARHDPNAVASLSDVRAALANGAAQVVDARSAERFRGEAPEPRPGLKSGHMPGSLNLPYGDVIEDGRLKEELALRQVFAAHGVDLQRPVITSCGSGVSAAVLALAIDEVGGPVARVYDGSWAEWGAREDCPVATGASLT